MKRFAIGIACAALTAVAAQAAGYDRNNDGQITVGEIREMFAGKFAGADSNGDGTLSMAEIQRAFADPKGFMEAADRDKSGSISQDEFAAFGMAGVILGLCNKNADAVLTGKEIACIGSPQ